MRILAVDSSGLTATAAVYSEGVILAAQSVNNKKTHSQTLLPMIKETMEYSGFGLEDIDAVAIAKGPGSFTGLRIGASTIKGLCLAINKPVIPVSTLAGLAYNVAGAGGIICPIMDARRQQVYTAKYCMVNDEPKEVEPPSAKGINELICELHNETSITFVGDGVPVFSELLKEKLGDAAHFAKPHMLLQNAASVAALASKLYNEGIVVEADDFEPVYLRLSQAEREKLQKQNRECENKV